MRLCNNVYFLDASISHSRLLFTTPVCSLIQSWRKKKGLPLNPNSDGPLTNKPDYSFLDGRPTPLGMKQKRRMIKQRDIATRIIQLSNEIDFAVERHQYNLKAQEDLRTKIIQNKLKPKGHLLLKEKCK